MRIITDPKLDFSDVLIVPKRSTLGSRSEVDVERSFKMKHSGETFSGVPIIAANMDTIGTFEMATELSNHKMITALHKHYSSQDLISHYDNLSEKNWHFYSMGIGQSDFNKFQLVYSNLKNKSNLHAVCIDVANGYSEKFLDFVKKFRNTYPTLTIMAGNVVTAEMTEELVLSGVDIVKVGIGGGCFPIGTMITTINGSVPIERIQVGDVVKTHTLSWRSVVNTFTHRHHTKLIEINENIRATPNHEFYVLNKRYLPYVNDDNLSTYTDWVSAEDLTSEHLLVRTINNQRPQKYTQVHNYNLIDIDSLEVKSISEQTYDFEVEVDHSYIANGFVVHNSVCTTRKVTGVGFPQLSAVFDAADAAHGLKGLICSDGGCQVSGDVSKAFAGGADFVMLGGMLSGHTEGGGTLICDNIKYNYEEYQLDFGEDNYKTIHNYVLSSKDQYMLSCALHYNSYPDAMRKMLAKFPNLFEIPDDAKIAFYGMSSKTAMDKHNGGVAEYRASEGKTVYVPFKGSVKNTIQEILGGVRSACTYTGASSLKELSKRTTFIIVHRQLNTIYGNN